MPRYQRCDRLRFQFASFAIPRFNLIAYFDLLDGNVAVIGMHRRARSKAARFYLLLSLTFLRQRGKQDQRLRDAGFLAAPVIVDRGKHQRRVDAEAAFDLLARCFFLCLSYLLRLLQFGRLYQVVLAAGVDAVDRVGAGVVITVQRGWLV